MFFDPHDPFPLPPPDSVSYEEKKAHAVEVDKWLRIETEALENLIRKKYAATKGDRELWLHKSPQVFSTPYIEIREILEEVRPRPEETVVDLGAGYCRMAFVLAKYFPRVRFVGVELVRERLDAGREALLRQGLLEEDSSAPGGSKSPQFQLIEADLAMFDIAALGLVEATFFIYDFGSVADIQTILTSLSRIAAEQRVKVIARGGRVRDLIGRHHAWLGEVVSPVHRPNYSFYRSRD